MSDYDFGAALKNAKEDYEKRNSPTVAADVQEPISGLEDIMAVPEDAERVNHPPLKKRGLARALID